MNQVSPLPQPIRVLVVDDHDVVHWGLRIMLERQPWIEGSYSAHSGAEAIASATRHEIDLALVDLFVGAESVADICERHHVARTGVRVLAVSQARGAQPPRGGQARRKARSHRLTAANSFPTPQPAGFAGMAWPKPSR